MTDDLKTEIYNGDNFIMSIHAQLIEKIIEFEGRNPHQVGHFLKVLGYAKTIGELEGLPEETQFILETSAIMHDIGIKPSREKYDSSAGKYQELEGPGVAQPILKELGYTEPVIERVCYLIAHHHTYTGIDGLDYQILVEADFLVNLEKDDKTGQLTQNVYEDIFKTESGKKFLRVLYMEH